MKDSGGKSEIDQCKDEIRRELEVARTDFHTLLNALTEEGWYTQSANPAWTNGQLLFHITLGFGLVPALLPIVTFFGRRPSAYSEKFAATLDWSTPLFNRINAIGPLIGARIYGRNALGQKFDRVHGAIVKRLEATTDEEWRLGMHVPVKWDPDRFVGVMRVGDLFRYPVAHFRHHQKQFVEP